MIKKNYHNLYKTVFSFLQEKGFPLKMNLATEDEHPTVHITASWADDMEHSSRLVEQFSEHEGIKQLQKRVIHADDFELFHNDGTVVESYYHF